MAKYKALSIGNKPDTTPGGWRDTPRTTELFDPVWEELMLGFDYRKWYDFYRDRVLPVRRAFNCCFHGHDMAHGQTWSWAKPDFCNCCPQKTVSGISQVYWGHPVSCRIKPQMESEEALLQSNERKVPWASNDENPDTPVLTEE